MAQSKFEQYLEILNSKKPQRVSAALSASANKDGEDDEASPLRTKQYLKTTLGGESPGRYSSQNREDGDTERPSKGKKNVILDFNQAELPFQSLQENRDRERRELATTIATTHADDARAGAPSISEYYSLAKRQGQKQEAQYQTMQAQIESLQSSFTLLLDKYDSLDYRVGFCESTLTQRLDHNNAHQAKHEANNDSRQSSGSRSNSQLRMQNRISALKNASQSRLGEESQQFAERINNLQIQIDRLDQRTGELRDEQMRQGEDPRPLIAEQVDNLLQHVEQNFAKKSALTASIDNLGEEIASDINSFENQLRMESSRMQGMSETLANLSNDLKLCQISIAKIPLPIDGSSETQNFSETLVKQLLRQGEDRKTSVEETKMLQSKIQEVKLTQKRHHEKQLKLTRQLGAYEEELRRNSHLIEKLRVSQHKITTIQTNLKFNKAEFVGKDEVQRMKERVNSAFQTLIRLHESTIDRDAIICESLLETQLGKLRRLIVKRHTHDQLKMFYESLSEPFDKPEILLSLKPEAAWRQLTSGENTLKGGIRKASNSGKRRRSNSSRRRSKSRDTNGSQTRGGTQRLSSGGVIKHERAEQHHSMSQKQPLEGQRRTVYKQFGEGQPRGKFDAYQDQSENDYYREQSSVFDDDINDVTDGEGDETVSYMEELPLPPKRKRSRSRVVKQRDGSRGHNSRRDYPPRAPNRHEVSKTSRRSQSQRSDVSKKSSRSQRVRKDYSRGERHHQYRQGSRDHRPRKGKCSKRQQSGLPQTGRSSNKDLQTNNSRNEQKFPMFGYQVCSSDTAGIGDIYDNTKSVGMAADKSHGGSTYKKNQQAQKGGNVNGYNMQVRQADYQQAVFAKEDDSIVDQQEEVMPKLSEASKKTLNQKNSYNYENSIQMWGGSAVGNAPSATK